MCHDKRELESAMIPPPWDNWKLLRDTMRWFSFRLGWTDNFQSYMTPLTPLYFPDLVLETGWAGARMCHIYTSAPCNAQLSATIKQMGFSGLGLSTFYSNIHIYLGYIIKIQVLKCYICYLHLWFSFWIWWNSHNTEKTWSLELNHLLFQCGLWTPAPPVSPTPAITLQLSIIWDRAFTPMSYPLRSVFLISNISLMILTLPPMSHIRECYEL